MPQLPNLVLRRVVLASAVEYRDRREALTGPQGQVAIQFELPGDHDGERILRKGWRWFREYRGRVLVRGLTHLEMRPTLFDLRSELGIDTIEGSMEQMLGNDAELRAAATAFAEAARAAVLRVMQRIDEEVNEEVPRTQEAT